MSGGVTNRCEQFGGRYEKEVKCVEASIIIDLANRY